MTQSVLEARPAPGAQPGETILELRGLEKRYPGTHALKPVDLAFRAGEIHAIVGENGAGKSTLIKLLTGVMPRTSGEVLWQGKPVALATPHEAMALGINAVHQEVVLCRHLTVAANMFLGEEKSRFGILQQGAMVREAQKIIDDLGFDLPAHVMLGDLTIGQQQLIAAARATVRGTRFLIFDEPTAYLTRKEADQLFALIRRLKAQGVTIVYISHRMEEVFELADRVTVLRDGTYVGTRNIAETNDAELVRMMINRTIEQIYHKETFPFGPTLLEARNLSGQGFEDVSMSVRSGEIVGLYGLIGAGRSEFVTTLYGRHPKSRGRDPVGQQAGRHPLRARRDPARHGARAGKPPRPGPVPQPVGRPQPQPADLQAHQPQPADLRRAGSRAGRAADRRPQDQDADAAMRWPPACRAATSRRSSSASGSTTAQSCSSSTSRPSASMSAPRRRSTGCLPTSCGRAPASS